MVAIHQLKNGNNEVFGIDHSDEKRDHNVYLKVVHWESLDEIAEEENKSRNQVLREILDEVLGIEDESNDQ